MNRNTTNTNTNTTNTNTTSTITTSTITSTIMSTGIQSESSTFKYNYTNTPWINGDDNDNNNIMTAL